MTWKKEVEKRREGAEVVCNGSLCVNHCDRFDLN